MPAEIHPAITNAVVWELLRRQEALTEIPLRLSDFRAYDSLIQNSPDLTGLLLLRSRMLLAADLAIVRKDPADAVRLLRSVPLQSPQLAGEVLPRLVRALTAAGREADLAALLGDLAGDGKDVADAIAHAAILAGALSAPALLALARDYVGREPAVAETVAALLPEGVPDEATLRRLCAALRRQALRAPRFRCGNCGFSAASFFWQCPGCKSWDTLKPLTPSDLAGRPPGAAR